MSDTPGSSRISDPVVSTMVDAMLSLAVVMSEETKALSQRARCEDHAQVAASKLRLTTMIEQASAQLHRERPDWMIRLNDDERHIMLKTIETLDMAATENRDMLERQLSLTNELMDAVTTEVRRLTGNRASTYSAAGTMVRRDQATPIAVNSGL